MSPSTVRSAIAFASASRRYWLDVFPAARGEIRRLRCSAERIPDELLCGLALETQRHKWACLEGAAAFATFVPRNHRPRLVSLLTGLQAVLDYVDVLMEQPTDTPAANARELHHAYIAALRPDFPQVDYYRHSSSREDGGYLAGLVEGCRASVCTLPSYDSIADVVLRHARRMVFYQSQINLATPSDYSLFARWASQQSGGPTLRWWELGAACGSSLAVFAQLTAAVDPRLTRSEVDAIEALYWPWAQALHILLDCLIDRAEDRETGQHNLLNHYASPGEMAERLGLLASETIARAGVVPAHHRLILAGMVALYLSDEQAWMPSVRPATERVLDATGGMVWPAMLLLRGRRLALKGSSPSVG